MPTPTWLFLKGMQMEGLPSDVIGGMRYYIEDHKRGAFEFGAPTTDVLEVTGRPAEDFETIARRYAALPRNRRTLINRMRAFAQFLITPLRPGPNLAQYDRELRRPSPSAPQFAPDSEVWRREPTIGPPTRTPRIVAGQDVATLTDNAISDFRAHKACDCVSCGVEERLSAGS